MAKFCQNCGTPYEEGTAFCSGCGANLTAPVVPKAPKTAITVAALREIANKRAKAMMIIVLVVSLLLGLSTISGSYDATVTQISEGKVVNITECAVKEAYAYTGNDSVDAASTSVKVLNILYGITLLGVAILTVLSMLENACGGKGEGIFKTATIIALGATALFALLFLILGRRSTGTYTFIIEVPVSAWVNLVLFGGIAAPNWFPAKKEA